MANYRYKRCLIIPVANLEKTIKKLNAPMTWTDEDGETYSENSEFDFTYKICDTHIEIWDNNEYYNIDYLEELNALHYGCAMEFGYKFEPIREDEVHDKLEQAVKKDLGKDKYLEWEDNVRMSVYF